MPSKALLKYKSSENRLKTLHKVATDSRLKPISEDEKLVYYHAALAVSVASWDAYIKNIIEEFYSVVADPTNTKFHAMYTISQKTTHTSLKKFNTPNWENTRNLLISCTGYDPYSNWSWPRRGLVAQQVKDKLNEILQVRHSFAHGFAIPTYSWTQTPSGKVKLTSKAIKDIEAFFANLVKATDHGMKLHIELSYGIKLLW